VGKPYVLPDGVTVVADDWADLTDETLDHAIDQTELMMPPPLAGPGSCGFGFATHVWTGTAADGSVGLGGPGPEEFMCLGWTSTSEMAVAGCSPWTTAAWSWWTVNGCSQLRALYCFEQ